MIFDSPKTTALVLLWQQKRDTETLERIIEESRSLVEAIVTGYGYHNREDLIQDAIAKLIFSLPYYSIKHGNLHTYFTTVIRNMAATTYRKEEHHDYEELDLTIIGGSYQDRDEADNLSELIEYERKRFPSLPVAVVDDASEFIYYAILDGYEGKSRGIVSALEDKFDMERSTATVLYQSVLIFLRSKYQGYCMLPAVDELSLLADLRLLVGEEKFRQISIAFSGMNVKFS